MLKIGLMGVGAAGNQVVALASVNELEGLMAVNSSKLDLESFEQAENVMTLALGEEGCGKDRTIGKQLLKSSIKPHLQEIAQYYKGYDMVYITGAGGGGTGSSMIPAIANILKNVLRINVGVLAISPKHSETMKAQVNMVEFLKEIKDLNIPYCIYDNNNIRGNVIETFDTINSCIVEDVKILKGELNAPSAYGVIDDMDNKKLIYTPGMFKIGKLSGIKENYVDSDKGEIGKLIVKSIKSSLCSDIERDKVVKRIGYILNLNKQVLSLFNKENNSLYEEFGVPFESFEQLNVIEENEAGKIAVLLMGLSFPDTRVEEMVDIVQQAKENLHKEESTNINDMYDSLDWFGDVSSYGQDENNHQDEVDLDNLLNNL